MTESSRKAGLVLRFKIATEEWEFDLIHRLNYRTFVEEIPQHARNPEGRLVDKFHAENTYLICLCGRELAGMLAIRGQRPFSLDQKLPDLDSYLPAGRSICEIRLLAVERSYRSTRVFPGLMSLLARHGIALGYDLAIISGTVRQLKLYSHIGFVPFGPLVGRPGALYQPMYLTLERFEDRMRPIFGKIDFGSLASRKDGGCMGRGK
jgi:hypothetical protein